MTRKLAAVLVAIIAAVLVGAGIAYASIPGPDGVIHACYKNSDGSLKAIDSAANCPNGYTPLNWNQTGPQGPAGDLSGLEYVQAISANDASQFKTVVVTCPTGKVVVSGGGFTGGGSMALRDSYAQFPVGGNPGDAWTVTAWKPVDDGQAWALVGQALCVNAPA
jgi:hypothetical protein